VLPLPPLPDLLRRLPRLTAGLVLFGLGIAFMVRSDLGLPPWDVLHQGISEKTELAIGTVGIITGVAVLLLWIPIRERVGVGTIANAVVIGLVVNAALDVLETPEPIPARVAFLLLGIYLFGPGSGLYIGVGLGPGPRDGLMTGLARRGWSVRVVRTGIELTVLAVGFLLGGTAGIGTLLFALTVGPNVHWHLERLTLGDPRTRREPDVSGSLEGY
jgi:uncharacterized membrane protein YczE